VESTPERQGVECADQYTYALAQISEFQELIRFADTKAGAAVTVGSGLLAVLLGVFDPVPRSLTTPSASWQFWLAVAVLVFSLGFFATFITVLYYAFLTFLPRLEKREYTPTLAFFLDVYQAGEDEFIKRISAMSTENLREHLLREVFLLSEILVPKFKAQRLCFNWLRPLILCWALAQFGLLFLQQ